MKINGYTIKKAPKRKYYLKKSTDPSNTVPTGTVSPAADGSLESIGKTEQAMDQFRSETRGTGQGVWEYLASQE
jgi:hypothetical protein